MKTKSYNSYNSYIIRLYPTVSQQSEIISTVGCRRFVYNYFLDKNIKRYNKISKFLFYREMANKLPSLKRKYPFLKDVDSTVLQQSLKDLDTALKNCYKHKKGFPKFKSKHRKQSFRIMMSNRIKDNQIKIGKLGFIKFRGLAENYPINSKIQSITVSQKSNDKWYASILVEEDTRIRNYQHSYDSCGIDLGTVNPIVISYGNSGYKIKGREFSVSLRKRERITERRNKQLSRKKKGSNNRTKARIKLSKSYYKENQLRKDWIEQTTTEIASTYKRVSVEDLKITRMCSNDGSYKRKLNRGMRRLGLGIFISRLEDKCKRYNGKLVLVNPSYTSQSCSECGYLHRDNRRTRSKFLCKSCGYKRNADKNAAKNIQMLGLKPKNKRTLGTKGI